MIRTVCSLYPFHSESDYFSPSQQHPLFLTLASLCKFNFAHCLQFTFQLPVFQNHVRASDNLRKLFQEVRYMLHSLINGANAYEYRRRALLNTKNQDALAMLAKFVLACFNYKKRKHMYTHIHFQLFSELSPFEESMLWAVSFPGSKDSESVANLSRSMCEVGEPDKTLSKKEILRQLHKNFRGLSVIFKEIRSETLEMGYKEFEHFKVTFNGK